MIFFGKLKKSNQKFFTPRYVIEILANIEIWWTQTGKFRKNIFVHMFLQGPAIGNTALKTDLGLNFHKFSTQNPLRQWRSKSEVEEKCAAKSCVNESPCVIDDAIFKAFFLSSTWSSWKVCLFAPKDFYYGKKITFEIFDFPMTACHSSSVQDCSCSSFQI
jgi:hypothetical protein